MSRPQHLEAETRFYFVTTNIEGHEALFANESMARTVIEALYFLRSKGGLRLHGFVVMPDHLHVVLSLPEGEELPKVMHSLKSFTAKQIDKVLGRSGKIWQDSYWSHGIRDEAEALVKLGYVLENPVRKGLVAYPEEYSLGSAHSDWEIDPLWWE